MLVCVKVLQATLEKARADFDARLRTVNAELSEKTRVCEAQKVQAEEQAIALKHELGEIKLAHLREISEVQRQLATSEQRTGEPPTAFAHLTPFLN